MSAKQLSDGRADGVQIGQSATDLVGFYGVDPAAQYTLPAALASTPAIKTTGALTYGFSTSAKGNALVAMVVALRACLIANGFAV